MKTIKFISNIDQSFMWETTNMNQAIPDNAVKVSENVYEMPPAQEKTIEEATPMREPITIPTFKALFTLKERIAIANSKDSGVQLLWADIEDQRTTEIHLDLPIVREGIRHIESAGCIAIGRASEILIAEKVT
jgi:hypothetical protein